MVSRKDSTFFKNLVWAIILIFALILFVQIALGLITRHGQEISVPDFYSMPLEEARRLAEKDDFRLDVRDSVFVDNIEHGAVFSQNPQAGEKVKKGRRILIVINSTQIKTVPMPSLVGLSLRAAKTEILAHGFKVGRLSYVTDMATDNVLEQRVGHRKVAKGDALPIGSSINLVLGVNPDENFTYVPNLSGLTLDMAFDELIENSLNLDNVRYDSSVVTPQDKNAAVVYSQSPAASSTGVFSRGTGVTLYLTVDSTKFTPVN